MKTNQPTLPFSKLVFLYALCSLTACTLPKDTLIDKSAIKACTQEEMNRFIFVRDKSEGLLVTNPTNEQIGTFKADNGGPWTPVNGRKMTGCGVFNSYSMYDASGDEHDLNFNIVAKPEFQFLLNDVINGGHRRTEEWNIGCQPPCNPNGGSCFQAEITFDESLYNNPWFKDREDCFTVVPNPNLCVYGPWVMDAGHDSKPEIHPCEAIWWRVRSDNQDVYTIIGAQDDSNRFDKASDFSGEPANWKPWAVTPLTASYKIPFEYSGRHADHLVINIEELKARNIVTPSVTDPGDSDDGNNHILRFKLAAPRRVEALIPSDILVEVNENIPLGIHLGVRFRDICRAPSGSIIGYVELFTAFGRNSSGEEGYHILQVTLNHPTQRLPDSVEPIRN